MNVKLTLILLFYLLHELLFDEQNLLNKKLFVLH